MAVRDEFERMFGTRAPRDASDDELQNQMTSARQYDARFQAPAGSVSAPREPAPSTTTAPQTGLANAVRTQTATATAPTTTPKAAPPPAPAPPPATAQPKPDAETLRVLRTAVLQNQSLVPAQRDFQLAQIDRQLASLTQGVQVYLNSRPVNVYGLSSGGQTQVPVRSFAESAGASVVYDPATRAVTVNGRPVQVTFQGDTAFANLRDVASAIDPGAQVTWDEATRQARVVTSDSYGKPTYGTGGTTAQPPPPVNPNLNQAVSGITQQRVSLALRDAMSKVGQAPAAPGTAPPPTATPGTPAPATTAAGTFKPTPFPQAAQTGTPQAGTPPPTLAPKPMPASATGLVNATRPTSYTPATFSPPASTTASSEERQKVAEAQTAAKYGPQKLAVEQGKAAAALTRTQESQRIQQGADEEADRIRREVAAVVERNRSTYGSRNIGVEAQSGFLAAADARAQAAGVDALQKIARDRITSMTQLAQRGELSEAQATAQLQALARAEGEEKTALMDRLMREDRQYTLQERSQKLQEFLAGEEAKRFTSQQEQQKFESDRAFDENVRRYGADEAFRRWQAETNIDMAAAQFARQVYDADRSFQESVRQFGINQALQAWDAENRMNLTAATFGENMRQFGMTYALDKARTDVQVQAGKTAEALASSKAAAELGFIGKYGYRPQEAALEATNLGLAEAKAKRELTDLELRIAKDPEYGATAEAKQKLDQLKAQTGLVRAQTVAAGQPKAAPQAETRAQAKSQLVSALLNGFDPQGVFDAAVASNVDTDDIADAFKAAGRELPTRTPAPKKYSKNEAEYELRSGLEASWQGAGYSDPDQLPEAQRDQIAGELYDTYKDSPRRLGFAVGITELRQMIGEITHSKKYGYKAPKEE